MDELISTSKVGKRHSIAHLLMSDRLTESGSPKIILSSMLIMTAVIFILILWAGLTQIDEITTAPGEIVPSQHIVPVQHLEGGIVYKVFVADGDIVKKGQPLFQLNPEPDTSDLNRLKNRQNSLEIDIYRLQSVLNGTPVSYNDLLSVVTYKDITAPELLKLQLQNAQEYQAEEIKQREYNQKELADRLTQEQTNLKTTDEQISHLNDRKSVLDEQVNMYNKLIQQQAVSKVDLINAQERLQEVIGNILTAQKDKVNIQSTILDLKNKLQTLQFDKDDAALKQLNDDTSQLLEVKEQIVRAQISVDRLMVRSEIDGIVKGLSLHPGDVVQAAAELFQIVPVDDQLLAEVKVATTDVGHIQIGDSAQVKVGTYDFSTYGSITGTLTGISASTFLDPEKKPYFKCEIALDTDYLGNDPTKNRVFPGMTVTADIKTGKRSLLKYMLKPINRTFGEAFRER